MSQELPARIRDVVREILATAKSLRLYPPSSPIPLESAEAAVKALNSVHELIPVLVLEVVREGFRSQLVSEPLSGPGSSGLSDMLGAHGIAEVSFVPGGSSRELVNFLSVVLQPPLEVRSSGGVGTLLTAEGVSFVTVSDVHLTVVEAGAPGTAEDVDEFLRELAGDPNALSVWLASASGQDLGTLEQSLLELSDVMTGPDRSTLLDTLARAFMAQDSKGKDAVMELALEAGPARDLTGDMLTRLTASEVAGSMTSGAFGQNMLSLSTALTRLPIGERFGTILSQVKELLPSIGHGEKDAHFLDHMIEARSAEAPERSLAEGEAIYQKVFEVATVSEADLQYAVGEIAQSPSQTRMKSVTTLLALLDQQSDFRLYCRTLESLSTMVPQLIGAGDLKQANRVLTELANREARADRPWPELTDKLRQARADAAGRASMGALLDSIGSDSESVREARDLVGHVGDAGIAALILESLDGRREGAADLVESLIGRRMHEVLPSLAPEVQWYHVALLTKLLAEESDSRYREGLEMLLARRETQVRKEVAKGLGRASGPEVVRYLSRLLADEVPDVAMVAARALAANGSAAAANALSSRLEQIDMDDKDFLLAREMIGALAAIKDPASTTALEKLARRKALFKRGRFAEVQAMARDALARQKRGGQR